MNPMHRVVIGLSLSVLALAARGQGEAADASAQAARRLTEAEAVMGILSHTRWPGVTRPLVLCVNSQSPQLAALRPLPEQVGAGRFAPVRALTLDAMHPGDCDAIYLGGGTAAETQVAVWIGLPVLTIGEGPGFCSRGGMFCLVSRPAGLRIEVNLDTVARSGLRVHPQVLKIGQPRTSGGSVP